jgi:hypothetical protein
LEIFHPQFDHGSHRGQGPDLGGHKKSHGIPRSCGMKLPNTWGKNHPLTSYALGYHSGTRVW